MCHWLCHPMCHRFCHPLCHPRVVELFTVVMARSVHQWSPKRNSGPGGARAGVAADRWTGQSAGAGEGGGRCSCAPPPVVRKLCAARGCLTHIYFPSGRSPRCAHSHAPQANLEHAARGPDEALDRSAAIERRARRRLSAIVLEAEAAVSSAERSAESMSAAVAHGRTALRDRYQPAQVLSAGVKHVLCSFEALCST